MPGGDFLEKALQLVVPIATSVLAPEAAPFLVPAEGAIFGGLSGGPLGALEGAAQGAVGSLAGGAAETVLTGSEAGFTGAAPGAPVGGAAGGAAGAEVLSGGGGASFDAGAGNLVAPTGASGGAAVPAVGGGGGSPALAGGAGAGGAADALGGALSLPEASGTPAAMGEKGALGGGVGVSDMAAAGAAPFNEQVGGNFGGSIMDLIKSNPALLAGGAAIGANALMKPSIPNLSGAAGLEGLTANAAGGLIPSLATGQLPPGEEGLVSTALNDAVAGIKARYASLGLSGSSMEQQDIAAATQRAAGQRAQLASSATDAGLRSAGLSDQIFQNIANLELNQDKGLRDAITGFAEASALGSALNTG